MPFRKSFVASILILSCLPTFAKHKKKLTLPEDILNAQTVLVVVDPTAGISAQDPNANINARAAVENAFIAWGRLRPVMEATYADLIITVRRGTGRSVQPTIGGVPLNGGPAVMQPSDSGVWMGGRHGVPPNPGDPSTAQQPMPHPQVEVGASDDTFAVYRGRRDNPLASPPVWRYTAKNALDPPAVPAVERFRKLIQETEKQKAAQP